MNRPYPTYPTRSRTRRFDDHDDTEVVDYDVYRDDVYRDDGYRGYADYDTDGWRADLGRDDYLRHRGERGEHAERADDDRRGDLRDHLADDSTGDPEDDLDDLDDVYEYVEPIDRRWMWVAGAAGAVLLVAVICTVVILGGGDSGSVSATVGPPAATTPVTAPVAPPAAPVRTPAAAAPTTALAPETVTTVAPSPPAQASPPAALPPAAAVPAPGVPNAVTYRVTGTRPLIDLVTVIYTDGQGALQTDVNVALPWTKAVTLDPGVSLGSVTATSLTGRLNCTIADSAGAVVAAQTNNSMITTCTR